MPPMKASVTHSVNTYVQFLVRYFALAIALVLTPALIYGQTVLPLNTTGATADWNNAKFEQGSGAGSAGTGLFDPFYRVKQASADTVQGVNTDLDGGSTNQFGTEGNSQWTTALLLSTVTQLEIGEIGRAPSRERV